MENVERKTMLLLKSCVSRRLVHIEQFLHAKPIQDQFMRDIALTDSKI